MSAQRVSDYTTLGEPGETVELVRWILGEDGWEPLTVTGRYLRHDLDHWQLVKGDSVLSFPRTLWQLCIA